MAAFDHIAPPLRDDVDHMRTYIQASMPGVDRDRIAAEFLTSRRLLAANPQVMIYRNCDIWALQLLGMREEAKEFAKQSRLVKRHLEATWPAFKAGNLASNDITESELLEDCCYDRGALAHAYFSLGVNSLAAGDRECARRHFENGVRTDQFPWYGHAWSAAFLQRMQDDPNWLPWLPQQLPAGTQGDATAPLDH